MDTAEMNRRLENPPIFTPDQRDYLKARAEYATLQMRKGNAANGTTAEQVHWNAAIDHEAHALVDHIAVLIERQEGR